MNKQRSFELLLVEDDSADVDLIKEALDMPNERPFDIHLNCVEDGEQAISFLRRDDTFAGAPRPDLVLLDLNMPRKGGYEVLREMKADDDLKSIPVVVLTTSSSDEDIEKSYRLGANNFITKAKGFAELAKIVQTIETYWFQVSRLPAGL